MSEYSISQQAEKETKRLMQARCDFDKLKKDEDKYLENREMKAQALLEEINKDIEGATKLLEAINTKIEHKTKEFKETIEKFGEGLFSLLDRAEKVLESSDNIKIRAEKTIQVLEGGIEKVKEKTKENSEFEKEIKNKEAKVDERDKQATEKLAEAKQLADWAKKGTRYKIKK